MVSIRDIAWVAGILEGEAWFGFGQNQPRINLEMTDRDIVGRVRDIIKPGAVFYARNNNTPGRSTSFKDSYRIHVTGHRAIGWMMTLYPLMGERRQQKICEVLLRWKSIKARAKLNKRIAQEIRELYGVGEMTQQSLADKFGIANSLVSNVVNGKVWAADVA